MYYQAQNQFGLTFDQVRKLYPNKSFPADGQIDTPEVSSYMPAPTPQYNPATHAVREAAPVGGVQQWEVYALPAKEATANQAAARAAKWEAIMAERDRRKALGVKVGDHWYHSDADSRIQQISLFVMGASVPPIQWKTLTTTPSPVFVTMTQTIAAGIFQNTAASDAAIFAAAETHRIAMEASPTPETYDFTGGWPVSIEDTP